MNEYLIVFPDGKEKTVKGDVITYEENCFVVWRIKQPEDNKHPYAEVAIVPIDAGIIKI